MICILLVGIQLYACIMRLCPMNWDVIINVNYSDGNLMTLIVVNN